MARSIDAGSRSAVVAVVPNYGTPAATIASVRSLAHPANRCRDVIVIDDASPDQSAARIRRDLPDVHVEVADRRGGFARASNLGIREALQRGADRVLLLNSDAVVNPGAVRALGEALERDPRLGIVAPLLVAADRDDRIESAGIGYSARTGRMRHTACGRSRREIHLPAIADVDAVSGCAMLIRREVFEAVGLLDDEYFFGFEDLDFCLRARAAGFACAVVADAVVRHAGQATIGRPTPRRLYFAARNHLRVAARFGPQGWMARTARAVVVVGLTAAYATMKSDVAAIPGLGAIGRGVLDHLRGRYGPDRVTERSYSTNR